MTRPKSQIGQHALEAMTVMFVLGALSMIWPGIIALSLGVLVLVQSCSVEQEMALLSWAEIGKVSLAVTPFR